MDNGRDRRGYWQPGSPGQHPTVPNLDVILQVVPLVQQ
jgi:hypothetical protein